MSSSPYAAAAQMLTKIWTQHKSIKTIAYDPKTGALKCSKATYAQVCHVLESQSVLRQILERFDDDGSTFANVRNEGLLYVLLYELLLGPNQGIRGGGALKRKLVSKEAELRNILKEVLGESSVEGTTTSVSFPRYIRINPFGGDADEVTTVLKSQWSDIYADPHVPDVLVLPPATSLHDHSLDKAGKIVQQDKSSCFSALCLIRGNDQPLEGDILDACAAPGNKTSHLAALLLGNRRRTSDGIRTVHALDRSSKRLALLERRLNHLGISHNHRHVKVKPVHTDFLQTKPSQFASVRGILLDPSCSGSGIFTLPDRRADAQQDANGESSARLKSLSNFQLTALRHAMSFPSVQRIVYSTCSLHEVENECVVSEAIAKYSKEWKIVAPKCLSHWKRRGHVVDGLTPQQAQCLIRADRDDETNGFFVCYLERYGGSENAPVPMQSEDVACAPMWTPPKEIPFYNGEFASGSSTEDESSSHNVAVGQSKPAAAKTTPTTARKNEKSVVESKPSAQATPAETVNKKRKKKLAWKQRQREQKQRRLEAKQQDKKAG